MQRALNALTALLLLGGLALLALSEQPARTQDISQMLAPPTGLNIIQNGEMLIDQANEGATVTLTGTVRVPDRWLDTFGASTSGAGTPTGKQQSASSGLAFFAKSVLFTANATPSTTTPAGLVWEYYNAVEGIDVSDLAFGTASAASVTVSLWLKTSLTNANIGITLANGANNRTYPHICNVPTAATWTKCSYTVPGDTGGTWLTGAGQIGMYTIIALAAGSTFQGTANTWNAGAFITSSAQTQVTDTANATVELTGVKIERGPYATAFVPTPMATLISQLQRYYRKSFPQGTAPAQNAGVAGATCVQNPIALGEPSAYVAFNPPMYAGPTIVTYNPSAANANWRDVTAASDVTVAVDGPSAKSTTGVILQTAGTISTLADVVCIHYTAATAL